MVKFLETLGCTKFLQSISSIESRNCKALSAEFVFAFPYVSLAHCGRNVIFLKAQSDQPMIRYLKYLKSLTLESKRDLEYFQTIGF